MKVRKIICVITTIIVLFISMMGTNYLNPKNVNAVSPEYSYDSNCIYYFSDSVPIIEYEDMQSLVDDDYDLCYDLQYYIFPEEFDELVSDGYFADIESGNIVVIEIKTFQPNPQTLATLFEYLYDKGCQIVFVNNTPLDMYENTYFMDYVTEYYLCGDDEFALFLRNSFEDMFNYMGGLNYDDQKICIFFDRRFFPSIEAAEEELEDFLIFLKFYTLLNKEWSNFCSILLNQLVATEQVTLLVNVAPYEFLNLNHWINGQNYEVEPFDAEDIKSTNPANTDYVYDYAFAFGIWELDPDYYDFIHEIQYTKRYPQLPTYENNYLYILPSYIWEYEPVSYGTNGLKGKTDSDLGSQYGPSSVDDDFDLLCGIISGMT